MSRPKISIIIPIYNTEMHIAECIESVLSQSCGDFELLLVDDGSTDKSGKICDEFSYKNPKIRVFHKANGGVSSARNMGIENARGEWLTFIDSDDWVEPQFLENFKADESGLDELRVQQIVAVKDGKRYVKPDVRSDAVLSEPASYKELDEYMLLGEAVGKLYSADIITRHNLRFDEGISLHEDHLFYFSYLCHVKKIGVTTKIGYNYRMGHNSQSLSSGGRIVNCAELLRAYDEIRGKWVKILRIFNLDQSKLKRTVHFISSIRVKAVRMAFLQNISDEKRKEMLRSLAPKDVLTSYFPKSNKGRLLKIILCLPFHIRFMLLKALLR